MKRRGWIFATALALLGMMTLLSVQAFSQSSPPAPKFLLADVHAVPPAPNPFMHAAFYKGGRYEVHTATMLDLVRTAYGVDPDKVLDGPAWMSRDLFEIVATAPGDTTPDSLKLMLQGLLAERFSLVAHRDTRPVAAYVITAGPKPLLKEADGAGETGCKIQTNTTDEPGNTPGANIVRANFNGTMVQLDLNKPFPFACRNMTMSAFTEGLRTMLGAQQYIFNTPVVDQTDLKGKWNFDVSWTFRQGGPQAPASATAMTIFDSFDKQLGLKLELSKAPFSVIVVDSVNPTPTPNPAEVTEKLKAVAPHFEIADLKPGIPISNTGGGGGGRGGLFFTGPQRITLGNQTLKSLIATAWNLNNAASVIGGPPSLEKAVFNLDALTSVPDLAPGFQPTGPMMDPEAVRLMLRTLLQERFKLQVHEEQRPVPVEELMVSNASLLKKADPAGRPGCIEGPGADGKDPRTTNPAAGRLVTCLNMTMADFATQLKGRASGYFQNSPAPLYDGTKLDGKYDFTLNFSGAGVTAPGAITLSEALDKQLGLKLGTGSHPGTAMVIDHCEETPLE